MNRKISRFRPTPMDALVILALLFWTCGAICSAARVSDNEPFNFRSYLLPMLFGCAAGLAAIGGTIAYGRPNWKSIFLLGILIAIGFVLYALAGPWITTPFPLHLNPDNPLFGYPICATSQPQFAGRIAALLVGAFIAGLVANLIFRFGGQFGVRLIRKSLGYFKANRSKCMIGIAIFLIVIGTIQNIFFPSGFFSSSESRRYLGLAILYLGYAFAFVLVVCVPIWLTSSPRWFAVKFVLFFVAVLAAAIAMATAWEFDTSSGDPVDRFAWPAARIVTPVVFLLSILGLTKRSVSPVTTSTETSTDGRFQFGRASIWSFLVTIPLVACICIGLALYDPGVLIRFQPDIIGNFENRFEAARAARKVARESRGVVRLVSPRYRAPVWWARMQRDSDPDCLSALAQFDGLGAIEIENLQPQVDASPLRNGIKDLISIRDGVITSTQIKEICNECRWIDFSNCELPSNFDSSFSLPNLGFTGKENSAIAKFLDAFIVIKEQSTISIRMPMTMEDWEALVRASQNRQIVLFGEIPLEVLRRDHASDHSLKNIRWMLRDIDQFDDALAMKFILNTDIEVIPFGSWFDEKDQWDLAFGAGNAPYQSNISYGGATDIEYLERARRYNWSYAWDDQGALKMIWIPQVFHLSQYEDAFSNVTTLRMDHRGIIKSTGPRRRWWGTLNVLKQLPSLERLYLPTDMQFFNLQFLGNVKKLKHLQIQSQIRTRQRGSGFEQCTQLESLLLFGTPDSQTLGELGMLKQLKRLTIVDDDLSYPLHVDADPLNRRFPNAEVRIIRPEDYEPELSDAFREHIAKIRQRLMERASLADSKSGLPAK